MKKSGVHSSGWKNRLILGLLGLLMVVVAGIAKQMSEPQRQQVISDASEDGENAPEPSQKPEGDSSKKYQESRKIALTFDDGPHPRYTQELLDGLAKRGVKATFFLLGQNIEGREAVVKRIAEEGHLIGNHTFYHVDITLLEREEACAEIMKTSELLTEITGQTVEFVRPPFGNWSKELECDVCMIPIFWSLDTLDWTTGNADQIVEKVVTNVEENDIILMHDSYESTVQAALRIVDLLTAKGYEFVTADELILE